MTVTEANGVLTAYLALGPSLARARAMFSRVVLLAVFMIACGGHEPEVLPPVGEDPVPALVQRYVAEGKSPAAFAALAVALTDASVGNPDIAARAEVRVLSLAAPFEATARSRPLPEQAGTLALTVWPALLADALTDAQPTAMAPRAIESVDDYLARLCAGPLVVDCGSAEPAQRAVIVRAVAMRNANARMQVALARCLDCIAQHAEWDRIGWTWDSLDREAAGAYANLRRERSVAIVAR